MSEHQDIAPLDDDEQLPGESLEERVDELEETVEGLVGGGGIAIWISAAALALAAFAAFFK